jgi:hypothetical protein
MCYTRSRIVCAAGIWWLNISLQVLHVGAGGAIFHVHWKVLPVPSGGAGILSTRRPCVVLVLLQRSGLPLFVLHQVAVRACVEIQVSSVDVLLYVWGFDVHLHWFCVASCYRTAVRDGASSGWVQV